MDLIGILVIIGIVIIIISSIRKHEDKTNDGFDKVTVDNTDQLRNDWTELAKTISQIAQEQYELSDCSRCDEDKYRLVKFNTKFTSAQFKCISCNKSQWVSSSNAVKNDRLITLYEQYTNFDEASYGIHWHVDTPPIVIKSTVLMEESLVRHSIPSQVKREVWQRDRGKCAKCGSQKKLEYDHIIPVSKGGSNTARNIQLLCESCNRKKYNNIE